MMFVETMPDAAARPRRRPAAAAVLGLLLFLAQPAAGQSQAPGQAPGQAAVERGRYLVESIAGCGNCHTPQGPGGPLPGMALAGNWVVEDGPPFRAVGSNITPDPATGIGAWSDAQIARAIREGLRPDGSLIGPPMPFEQYRGIGDADLAAMVAYLRSVPPVSNTAEKSTYRIPLPPAYGPPVTSVAAPSPADPVAYGGYLAGPLGHCMTCHTPMAEGGRSDASKLGAGGMVFVGPWGATAAPNITPLGLGGWSDAEIERAIRHGVSRDGRRLTPPMAFAYYQRITPADMAALIAYLRQLPPVDR